LLEHLLVKSKFIVHSNIQYVIKERGVKIWRILFMTGCIIDKWHIRKFRAAPKIINAKRFIQHLGAPQTVSSTLMEGLNSMLYATLATTTNKFKHICILKMLQFDENALRELHQVMFNVEKCTGAKLL